MILDFVRIAANIGGQFPVIVVLERTAAEPFNVFQLANELNIHTDAGHHGQAVVADDTVCGQVRLLFNQDYPGVRGAEVTYMLGEAFWGKGLMTRVLSEFTRKSIVEHSLDFICAWIRPENIGSVRCAERSGYVRDSFGPEEELARRVDRDGFVRFKCYRADLGV